MADYPDYTGTIDILAQEIGVYIGAEWEVKAGNDKFLSVITDEVAVGDNTYVEWEVTAGKTYYINYVSFSVQAFTDTDRDKNQMGMINLYNAATGAFIVCLGGNGGGSISLPSPAKIAGGQKVRLYAVNRSYHVVDLEASCGGYVV